MILVTRVSVALAAVVVFAAAREASPVRQQVPVTVPDCTRTGAWPTMMTMVQLKNEGIIDPTKLDQSKTKTIRLASEQIGKDLFRQVHRVTLTEKTGKTFEAITISDA